MSSSAAAGSIQPRKATRSSRACLPCRTRHLKCDGKQPCCGRCAGTATSCLYTRSRRGGLDRARLAERRRRLAAAGDITTITSPSTRRSESAELPRLDVASSCGVGQPLESSSTGYEALGRPSSTPVQNLHHRIEDDTLVDAYYKHFHKLHPFILPQKHLARLYYGQGRPASFAPLIATLRFVGNICSSREWSIPLKNDIEACFAQAAPADPTMVQCHLLYSMVLLWYCFTADAKREMSTAVKLAVDLQMFRREFAAIQAHEDPVLKECWRRTWWMLCAMDVYFAGTLGTTKLGVLDIEATVELPCEEAEYESGEIPEPKLLRDFDNREFAPDNVVFSSFAYLVGAIRSAALAMSIVPKNVAKEGSSHIVQAADSILDGWLLLLPKEHKQVMTKAGEVDELMFQAHLLVNITTISLHRPFSDLKFNPVEGVSSCARETTPVTAAPELVSVHTIRVLRSIEAQIRLLALPTQQFHHTPFATCMVTGGTLALLSACSFLFKGTDIAIARGQIRMTIGRLRALGELWPRAIKNLREIQTVAHHVLGLGLETSASGTLKSGDVSRISDTEEAASEPGPADVSNAIGDIPHFGDMEYLCGWYNFGSLDPNLVWDISSEPGGSFETFMADTTKTDVLPL